MPASGIKLSDEGYEKYTQIKQKKDLHWVKYGLDETKKHIIVKGISASGPDFDYEEMQGFLSESECCYMVVDLKWQGETSGSRQKLLFVTWCPEGAPVREKMLIASSKDEMLKKFQSLPSIQATEASEVTFEALVQAAKEKMTERS